MHSDFEYKWQKKFYETEGFFRETYPALSSTIDSHLWYSEMIETPEISEMEKLPLTVDRSFWAPDEQTRLSILRNVSAHLDEVETGRAKSRLRKKKTHGTDAPLNELPMRYDHKFEPYMNDRTIRLQAITPGEIRIQQACYLDQLGSNILCDRAITGQSLREQDRKDGGLPPLEESKLANTVGVACIFVGADDIPVLRWREQKNAGEEMAIMQQGWHCTSSGVLKFDDVVNLSSSDESYTLRDFRKGLLRESAHEAGIWEHENLFECKLIGFARELKRAGKPQFFYRIQFREHSAKEIADLIRSRYHVEGDEYAPRKDSYRMLRPLLSRLKTSKPSEAEDFLVDESLALSKLTRDDLTIRADKPKYRMTYECFANLWLMAKQ